MNSKTIRYKIREQGFEYHVKKCIMKASGCNISDKVHPIKEVEVLKHQMIDQKKLVKTDSGYALKTDYQTGLLMAYNLCSDKVKTGIDNCRDIVINGNNNADNAIKDFFEIKNVSGSDSIFGTLLRKDEYKIDIIQKIEYSPEFYSRADSDGFSESEYYVALCLKKFGIINEFRRGVVSKNEADVVLDTEKRQIEIVQNLNYANNLFRFGNKASEISLVLDCIDTGHFGISDGVIKKFTSKKYCDEYTKELAILMIGTRNAVCELMTQLGKEIQKQNIIKNDFTMIHFVIINPLEDEVICISGNDKKVLPIDSIPVKLYDKRLITLKEMQDTETYVMTCNSLFNNNKALIMLDGLEIKKMIKDMGIWKSAINM